MRNRMFWTGLAIFLALCIVLVFFMIFSVRRSPIPEPDARIEEPVVFEGPTIGEEGENEMDVDIIAYPTYTGPVSLDAVKSWIEDPSNLIDDTDFTIRGNIEF